MPFSEGTYIPPKIQVSTPIVFRESQQGEAFVEQIETYAGPAIGSAIVRYPLAFAEDLTKSMGASATITADGAVIFHGYLCHVPYEVTVDADELKVVLFDDKWLMSSRVVAQPGIGSVLDAGFKDVGYDIIFNANGRPNRTPGIGTDPDFQIGKDAEYWTLRSIMHFIFNNYIPSNITLSGSDLSSAYDKIPAHINLIGMQALQAVDAVASLAGESWGLVPKTAGAGFVPVKPGGDNARTIRVNNPEQGGLAVEANEYTPSSISVSTSIKNARDVHQAISGNILKEQTYSTGNKLLDLQEDFRDKEFAVRFKTDITMYKSNGLGEDLSDEARPKIWLGELLTRYTSDGSDYLAGPIDPDRMDNPKAAIPVWISTDGSTTKRKLCVGGYRIDTEGASIDFKSKVAVFEDGASEPTILEIADQDWKNVGVWITVATMIEQRVTEQTDNDSKYLPEPFYTTIFNDELTPEIRENSMLPDISVTNKNAVIIKSDTYVDVEDRLKDAVNNSILASSVIERTIDLQFGFLPRFNIGDSITISGRETGAAGNEVITSIRMNVHEAFEVSVQATNVIAAVNSGDFLDD